MNNNSQHKKRKKTPGRVGGPLVPLSFTFLYSFLISLLFVCLHCKHVKLHLSKKEKVELPG